MALPSFPLFFVSKYTSLSWTYNTTFNIALNETLYAESREQKKRLLIFNGLSLAVNSKQPTINVRAWGGEKQKYWARAACDRKGG